MTSLPQANCYWVEPGRILAGEYPGHYDPDEARRRIGRLLDAGVRSFIDLTEAGELVPYEATLLEEAARRGIGAVAHLRLSIPDVSVPRIPGDMVRVLDALEEAVRDRPIVYIHCWGGVGRTGTVVGCYFRRRGRTGDEALADLARLWARVEKARRKPSSPETPEQHNYVRSWAEAPAAEAR